MLLKRMRESRLLRRLFTRALHAWFLVSRGLTLGVRGAAIDGAGRVCLVRHTYVPGWHLPGGGLEIGEDAPTALRRELREEAAIEIVGEPVLHGVVHNYRVSRRDHVLIYVIRAFRVGERLPDREIAEIGFFPLDDLPAGTTRDTRARLAEVAAAGHVGSMTSGDGG